MRYYYGKTLIHVWLENFLIFEEIPDRMV